MAKLVQHEVYSNSENFTFLSVPTLINQCWSMDFMHDQLADIRSYRLFIGGITGEESSGSLERNVSIR